MLALASLWAAPAAAWAGDCAPGLPGERVWYHDGDGDGWGDPEQGLTACEAPPDYIDRMGDCDDTAADVFPGAAERCDGRDSDCDEAIDAPHAIGGALWYADADADGWGTPLAPVWACEAPIGYASSGRDCDDQRADVSPGEAERCDGVDDDCNGAVDAPNPSDGDAWYRDADQDGWGDASLPTIACEAPDGFVLDATDCDDGNPATWPGAEERCDGEDNDCDTLIDQPDPVDARTWYADADGDRWGDPAAPLVACEAPAGAVARAGDCDDTDAAILPSAVDLNTVPFDPKCEPPPIIAKLTGGAGCAHSPAGLPAPAALALAWTLAQRRRRRRPTPLAATGAA